MVDFSKTRTVGNRKPASDPKSCFERALVLQRQAELLNPNPRPRGFVFKARTYEQYAQWRQQQTNPRLW